MNKANMMWTCILEYGHAQVKAMKDVTSKSGLFLVLLDLFWIYFKNVSTIVMEV